MAYLPQDFTIAIIFLCLVFPVVYCKFCKYPSVANVPLLPPGPAKFPFVGSILKVPPCGAWLTFSKYRDIYGDLLHFQGLGNNVLVLNSLEAINDLLDKRGNNYSHRPIFTVAGELMGLGQSMPLLPYGEEWRSHRKLAHIALSPSSVKVYHRIQENLAIMLCNDLLRTPNDFFSLVRLTAGRIIVSVTYGLPVGSSEDKYITHAEKTMDVIGKATVPGAFLCDLLPILKHLPKWVSFQQKALEGKAMIEQLVTMPFEHVKAEMSSGGALPSLTCGLLEMEHESISDFEHKVKWTAGAIDSWGRNGNAIQLGMNFVSETDLQTYATVLTFMMAMALYPSKQEQAQKEIDNAIGMDRLPTMDDAQDLPYVRSVIKETMRWHPVLPLSIARRTDADDVYNGFFIQKGTIVVPNVYAIASAPSEKYDPRDFIPERFLDPEEVVADPSTWAFGFGRRICPGRYLAENSVFIIISSLLATFSISSPEDTTLSPEFGQNLVSYPEPFQVNITPRHRAVEQLIRQRAAQCDIYGRG
ncbi:hypothetical protein ACEPAF_292 [Sanghuangporus sanghuang]